MCATIIVEYCISSTTNWLAAVAEPNQSITGPMLLQVFNLFATNHQWTLAPSIDKLEELRVDEYIVVPPHSTAGKMFSLSTKQSSIPVIFTVCGEKLKFVS